MKQRDDMDRASAAWMEAVPVDETRGESGEVKALRVRGYAILFNSPSERMGRVVETIDPTAFDHLGELNALDVRMQGEHEGIALARTTNGTLRLTKDERGVRIEADLDTRRADARDLFYAIERGDLSKMSFGFRIAAGGETLTEQEDGTIRAHVTRVEKLHEVSGVNFPAYRETSIEAVTGDPDEEAPVEDDADRSWEIENLRRRRLLEDAA